MKANSFAALLCAGLGASRAAAAVFLDAQPLEDSFQRPLMTSTAPSAASRAPAYREELLALHKNLVEIESISGTEGAVGEMLVAYLTQRNYTVSRQYLPPLANTPAGIGRFNVVAWPKQAAADQSDNRAQLVFPAARVLVTSHIDVVPPHIPYAIDAATPGAVTAETAIRGRGSVDAKGSVAAQITALEALRASGAAGTDDVMLLFVVGEEVSGDGMKAFSRALADSRLWQKESSGLEAAIFGEPTENKLACGHKGILGCELRATGRAGHSGYPWLGKSANEVLLRGLLAVLDRDLGTSDRFGNTTVNIGRLDGGVAGNVIPAAAEAQLAIRVATGPQSTGHLVARGRIEEALRSVDADALRLECSHGYGVVECDCSVDGFETITVNYGTDVPHLQGNHTRYLYGPGTIFVAHSDHEALTVGDLETAVEAYKKLIQHALRK